MQPNALRKGLAKPSAEGAQVLPAPLHAAVYARHGREPFGPELKAEGLMGFKSPVCESG